VRPTHRVPCHIIKRKNRAVEQYAVVANKVFSGGCTGILGGGTGEYQVGGGLLKVDPIIASRQLERHEAELVSAHTGG